MRVVSPLLRRVVYPGLSMAGCLPHILGNAVIAVTYHGVLPGNYEMIDAGLDGSLVTAGALRKQLQFLTTRYRVIDPEEFRLWCETGRALPARCVLLTCDDGLLNTVTDMLPILQEFRIRCLFFVSGVPLLDTATLHWYEELYLMLLASDNTVAVQLREIAVSEKATGRRQKRRLWWKLVKHFSQLDMVRRRTWLDHMRIQLRLPERWHSTLGSEGFTRRFALLNEAGLRLLADSGMTIGAHSISHPMLSQLPPELAWKEIRDSRRRLEEKLNTNIWAFAYPFGDSFSVGSREVEMVKRAGFTCAFLNEYSQTATTNLLATPRVHVTANMSLPEFEAHISGIHSSLRQFVSMARRNHWKDNLAHSSV
jgi:peptidoglycan/xylan/chitin deacetylase (PgdA/CDA1 family)